MRLVCHKAYHDIPFAHRAPLHDGHCKFVHGHNWSFKFTFEAKQLDENGFVMDFGKLAPLRAWLGRLDHSLVIPKDDPDRRVFETLHMKGLVQLVLVDHGSSCEAIAKWAFEEADRIVREATEDRAFCIRCIVNEDAKNSATCTSFGE